MFSDRFIVVDKYSLTSREKVSTIEAMPRRFTSLVDSQYLPEVDANLRLKMNKYFEYHFDDSQSDPEYEFNNYLFIEHVDGEVIEYQAKRGIRFSNAINHWNDFSSKIDCPEFANEPSKIIPLTSTTKSSHTFLTSLFYNKDGTYNGYSIYDDDYNFNQFGSTEFLEKINKLPQVHAHYGFGRIRFKPDTTDIAYKLFYNVTTTFEKKDEFVYEVERRNEKSLMYLDTLTKENLDILTDDDVDYIKSICTGNSWFDIEFIVGQDGLCKDMFVHVHKVAQFEDLTVG